MTAKELKAEKEKIIKGHILEFQKETGLKVSHIEVEEEKKVGFSHNEDAKINIRLKD